MDADDLESVNRLTQDGWREIEILETWTGKAPHEKGLSKMAREEDIDKLMLTAVNTGGHSRLYRDARVSKRTADMDRMNRIEKSVRDKDTFVFIDGASFLSMKIKEGKAVIDQIAVSEQGKGIASGLIKRACGAFNVDTLQAGTQETNEPAKALYRSLGLKVTRRQRTFHR